MLHLKRLQQNMCHVRGTILSYVQDVNQRLLTSLGTKWPLEARLILRLLYRNRGFPEGGQPSSAAKVIA